MYRPRRKFTAEAQSTPRMKVEKNLCDLCGSVVNNNVLGWGFAAKPMRDRPAHLLLRLALLIVCIPPLVYGTAAVLSGAHIVTITALLSSGSVTLTPEIDYLLKPLGLYVFMFGALMAYAIFDPVRNRAIVTWGALVLFLRAIQRLFLTNTLQDLFDIPIGRNLVNVGYLTLMALILIVLRPKKTDS